VLPLQLTQERELGVEQLVGVGQGRRAYVRFGGGLAAGDRRDAEGRRLGRAPPAVQLVDVVVVGVDGPADEPYGAGGDRGGRDHRSVSAVPGVDRGIQPTAGRPEGRLTRLQRGVVVREQTALDVVVLVDRMFCSFVGIGAWCGIDSTRRRLHFGVSLGSVAAVGLASRSRRSG
jgi:hypothetical protein